MKNGSSKPRNSKSVVVLSLFFVGLVMFVVFNLSVVFRDAEKDQGNLSLASELRALSYRVSGLARESSNAQEEAFGEMGAVLEQMQDTWDRLRAGGTELPAPTLSRYQTIWNSVKENAETILADKETILFLNQVVITLNNTLPQLQQEHTQIVDTLLKRRAPADQVAVAQAQSWRAERIGRNVDKMLAGSDDAEAAADQFHRDASFFGKVLEGMKKGDAALGISRISNQDARASLDKISKQFGFVSSSVQEIFGSSPALFRARKATDAILDDTPALLESLAVISDQISALPEQRDLTNNTALYAGIGAVILLALLGMSTFSGTKRRLRETAEDSERNQQAILRLLDEIEGLGDGDLTAEATVTEDFTGAIADAINFAILQLRELVARIQDTAENVSAAANETRSTALQLAEASEHQAQEIAGASAATNEMAITIDQVSANAAESATVADRSVAIAGKGANVVQNTVRGMDTIREQIQDTSKRIKRLGESSQEIGDIVSLISDIADQTNILALNAAIQASMAGDAGRGFAVVADEVQRLAERSANATKQIASLVKTIQTDTNEAVSSMEQTTSEVVKGAELAHDAGKALGEIQDVSANLAELIQDISTAARHQATTAGQISNTMNVIQDITSQTLSGTNNTASSIGELAEMAVELRQSVSGFKLPVKIREGKKQALRIDDETAGIGAAAAAPESAADKKTAVGSRRVDSGATVAAKEDTRHELSPIDVDLDEFDLDDLSSLGDELQPERDNFALDLETELAQIDLDEFDLDLKPSARKQSS